LSFHRKAPLAGTDRQAPRPEARRHALLLLPVLAGILAAAAFPDLGRGDLAWVALTPLVYFVARVGSPVRIFSGVWLGGIVQYLGILYWIPGTLVRYGSLPLAASWGLFLLMAALLASFQAAACVATRSCMNRRGAPCLLLFAPAWVAAEYLRSSFPFGGFPWMLLGYSQTDSLRLIQVADITGVWGISLLIAWVNTALVWAFLNRRRLASLAPLAGGLAGIAAFAAYGSASLRHWDAIQPDRRAAMLQGNLSVDEPDSSLRWKYLEGYLEMADQLAPGEIDLLLLPESPSPILYQHDRGYREALSRLARRFPLGMVLNNVFFSEAGGSSEYFNSAFFLDKAGQLAGRYDKVHLVPFGEYVPLQTVFFFSRAITRDVGNFHPGSDYPVVPLDGHPANAIICFEAVFPDLSREFVLRGSQLIINLTNDGWYGDTAAPYQHLAMARWRAIESRRFLLRAANSGISAVVAPSGRIQVRTGLLRRETAVGSFAFLPGMTFYARHGGFCRNACVIILCLALLWSLATRQPGKPAGVASWIREDGMLEELREKVRAIEQKVEQVRGYL